MIHCVNFLSALHSPLFIAMTFSPDQCEFKSESLIYTSYYHFCVAVYLTPHFILLEEYASI